MFQNDPGVRMIVLEAQRGRLALNLTARRMGRDLWVTLSGGDRPHIGAVAVFPSPEDREAPSVITQPGHREDVLAADLACRLSHHLDAVVCVACGIHLDDILPEELRDVHELVEELTRTLLGRLDEGEP